MIKSLSIRYLLPILIVAPSVLVMGMITFVLFHKTREDIDIVAVELATTIADHVEDNIRDYLRMPNTIAQLNLQSIQSGSLNPTDLSNLEQHFWRQIQVFNQVNRIYFSNPDGELRGATIFDDGKFGIIVAGESTNFTLNRFLTLEEGSKLERVGSTPNYDPRLSPGYEVALESDRAVWSTIYRNAETQDLTLTAAQVVRDTDGELIGVLGVDFLLEQMNQFLQSLTIGKTGQTLIIDRQGQLIASSNPQLIAEANLLPEPLPILNSEQGLITAVGEYLQNQFGSFSQVDGSQFLSLRWKGRRQYLKIKPFRDQLGLDWLILVVIPEQDFMQQVQIQAQITLVLEILILLSALGVGLGVSRWVLQPIFQFSEAADRIKTKSFDRQTLEELTKREDEVGELARVFVKMAVETGDRQHSLEEQLSLLNFRISQSQDNPYELTALKRWQKKASCIREVHNYKPYLPQLLSQVPWYKNLNPEQLEELSMYGEIKRVDLGDYICREDEPGDEFYIILTGAVRIFVQKIDKHLVDLCPGECFGELALMLGGKRTATAIALEETVLFSMNRPNFSRVLHQYPQMAEQIAEDMHRHQIELQERQQTLAEYGFSNNNSDGDLLQQIKHRIQTLFHLRD